MLPTTGDRVLANGATATVTSVNPSSGVVTVQFQNGSSQTFSFNAVSLGQCSVGATNCACTVGGLCNSGLSCNAGLCKVFSTSVSPVTVTATNFPIAQSPLPVGTTSIARVGDPVMMFGEAGKITSVTSTSITVTTAAGRTQTVNIADAAFGACSVGQKGCACQSGSKCQAGLMCMNNLCTSTTG